ncbi:hypothetical protein WH50_24080 [Pokkaliibacter plantistimulans]|uniref:Rap1a immunity protein domain-containing protein n=2 Tax=Pseudomonadota TaxID=1224 RepID=A0ABX5LR24_9GAMM|nr:hypothetical protein [Pokkaliibacter plantistimulans]PPC78321.1 hypothetical protein C4K68_05645 [Pokkaliibacter plantistimulans]PXF28831.1 hypothetical protein WH50_24080 [Pokkaliibacter plantistimulans]
MTLLRTSLLSTALLSAALSLSAHADSDAFKKLNYDDSRTALVLVELGGQCNVNAREQDDSWIQAALATNKGPISAATQALREDKPDKYMDALKHLQCPAQ